MKAMMSNLQYLRQLISYLPNGLNVLVFASRIRNTESYQKGQKVGGARIFLLTFERWDSSSSSILCIFRDMPTRFRDLILALRLPFRLMEGNIIQNYITLD